MRGHARWMSARYLTALVAATAAVLSVVVPARAETLDSLRAALARTRCDFTSVRATVRETISYTDAFHRLTQSPLDGKAQGVYTGKWAAKRKRVWQYGRTVWRKQSGTVYGNWRWASYDGSRRITVDELNRPDRPQQVYISKRFRLGGTPLDYGYTFLADWYADVLAAPGFRVTGSTLDPKYGKLTIVQGTTSRGVSVTIRFASERGYLAVSAEVAEPAANCPGYVEAYRVDELRKVAALWVPIRGSYEWRMGDDGKPVTVQTKRFALTDVKVGQVPGSVFSPPAYLPGSLVRNEIERTDYKVGTNGELLFQGLMGDRSGGGR
jgi:hypothetical protein